MPHINNRRKRIVRFLRQTALGRVLRWGLCHHWFLSMLTIIINSSSLSHTFFFDVLVHWYTSTRLNCGSDNHHRYHVVKVRVQQDEDGNESRNEPARFEDIFTMIIIIISIVILTCGVITIIYINITTTILGKAKIRSRWNIKERTLDRTTDWIRTNQELFVNTPSGWLPANQFAPLLFPHVAHVWWCVMRSQKVEPL